MAFRWLLLLSAGLTGCVLHARTEVPAPRLVVVVGTDLRYCEACDDDVFFYSDYWWAYRSDGWYRRPSWSAPWVVVELGRLPAAFIEVPPARFRHRYGQWHPAHDHHPARDHWTPAASPAREDGRRQDGDAAPGRGEGRRGDAGSTADGDAGSHRAADAANGREADRPRERAEDRHPDGGDGESRDPDRGQGREKVKEKKTREEPDDKMKKKEEQEEKEKARAKAKAKRRGERSR